mgnify:CR=1 FL=1
MRKLIIFLLISFIFLNWKLLFAQITTEELIIETPYIAEGTVDELIQLKEAGDIKTFQEKLEDFMVSVFPSLQPPVITDVEIKDITTNSVTITWKTNVKSNSIVAIAEDKDYDPKKENPYVVELGNIEERVKDHKVIITNLRPGTLYHFQVKSASLSGVVGKSKDYTFSTLTSKIKLEVVKVTNKEIEVRWVSPKPTNSFVEYKNLKTGKNYQVKTDEFTTIHSLTLKDLEPGMNYQLRGFGYDEKNILIETDPIGVKTKLDLTPPKISNIKINSAIVPGSRDQALTIVMWSTDEPANSIVYYDIGLGGELKNKVGNEKDYSLEHAVIIPTKAGSVYRINIVSVDESGNKAESGARTVFTPRGEQSILEIMIKNFEEAFKFLRKK